MSLCIKAKSSTLRSGINLHSDLRKYYDLKIWLDCPLEAATIRGMARDKSIANNHDELWLNTRDFMAKCRPD